MKKQQQLNIFINLTGVPESHQEAYKDELDHYARFLKHPLVKTIYISALDKQNGTPELVDFLLGSLDDIMVFDDDPEISLELNPDNMDPQILDEISQAGVNRISFTYQHGVERAVLEALSEKAKACFDVVNFDLKLGRVEKNERQQAVSNMAALCQHHFTTYGLKTHEEFLQVKKWVQQKNYEPYDPFHYARGDHACRYLVNVLRYEDYIGLGPGAHGCLIVNNQKHHTENPDDVEAWQEEIRKKVILTPLSDHDVMEEFLLQNLTLYEGIDIDYFEDVFGTPLRGLFNVTQAQEVMNKGKPVILFDNQCVKTADNSPEGTARAAHALLEARIKKA